MLFNSNSFLIFFVCVLVVHYLPLSWRLKKINLLIASYLFYATWNPPFIAVLMTSTVVDWFAAGRIHQAQRSSSRKIWLALSLIVNLGMLAFFKYGEFTLDGVVGLLGLAGIGYLPPELDIVLPVGISFYTFQTLTYTLDVYRKEMTPWSSFLDYALYVTFFPQLVAGPIVRAREFLPQCVSPRKASANGLAWGLALLVFGLFQKSVLADSIFSGPAERLFDLSGQPSALAAWVGTVAFTGQILCDFSGYSTCAIGIAFCLGFALPENFRAPYAAIGFSDFWRRWHITLSTWLRDFLYISLGGNQKGLARTGLNLLITMFLGGLWHGASWTFVAWGLLHGLYLTAERVAKGILGGLKVWETLPGKLFLALLTFLLVMLAWVLFRAPTFGRAHTVLTAMFGLSGNAPTLPEPSPLALSLTLGAAAGILVVHWLTREISLREVATRTSWPVRGLVLGLMLAAVILAPGDDRAFIYFQF